jgi:hypothetical protein
MSPVYSLAFQTIGHLWSERQTLKLASRMHLLLVDEPNLQRRAAERRAAVRYRLRLPVIFHWNDGNEHTGGGFTNDVALDGALIFSSKCPPVGSDIRIEVLVPSPDLSGEELCIECVGKVTRVAEQAGCFGVHGTFDDDHLTRHVFV